MSKRVSRFRKTKAEGAKGLAGEQMARRLGGSQVDGGVGYGLPQKAAHVPPDPICFDHFAHAGFIPAADSGRTTRSPAARPSPGS